MPSITITTTAPQAQRIAAALGGRYTLKDQSGAVRSATDAEVKAWVIDQLRNLTLDWEREQAVKAITISPLDPT